MNIIQLIIKCFEFARTEEYIYGVFIEFTGVIIEIILVVIAIPIFIKVYQVYSSRHIRWSIDFYIFQLFHSILRSTIKIAGVDDWYKYLIKELCEKRIHEIFKHHVYGNIENLIYIAKKELSDESGFSDKFKEMRIENIQDCSTEWRNILSELDQLNQLIQNFPNLHKDLLLFRMPVYVTIDALDSYISKCKTYDDKWHATNEIDTIKESLNIVLTFVENLFQERRKLTDKMYRRQRRINVIGLVLLGTSVTLKTFFKKLSCKIRRKPYTDESEERYGTDESKDET